VEDGAPKWREAEALEVPDMLRKARVKAYANEVFQVTYDGVLEWFKRERSSLWA
jgi:hypothetical protein